MRTTRMHPHRKGPAVSRPFLEIIKARRESLGLSQAQAGERIQMGHANWGVVERGVTLSPGIDKVALMAQAVGLKLVLVPEDESPLDLDEMRALGRLAQWYLTGHERVPDALRSAARKLIPYALKVGKK